MYTQCPDCKTAFRVAADDLRQAAGKVRCGDCGAAFDALLYLSEDLPEPDGGATSEPVLPELKHESTADHPKLPESISANESIALLQTLDELAGSDVRIEDTGIEWRVLDDVAMSEMGPDEAQLHDETSADGEAQADDHPDVDEEPQIDDQPDPVPEVRYDDDSPLPDELAADDNGPPDNEADKVAESAADDPVSQLMVDDIDADEIDDSGDWEAILDDIAELAAESADDHDIDDEAALGGDDLPADKQIETGQEEPGDEGNEAQDEGADDSIDESQDDIGDDIEIVLEGDDAAAGVTEADADDVDAPEPRTGEPPAEDSSPSLWELLDEDTQDESIPTLNESQAISSGPDVETAPDDDSDLYAEEDIGVESIVMEGDSVRFALDDMEAAASLRAAAASVDFSATHADAPPTRSKERRGGLLFLAFLLLAALGLQVVHQQRDTLAKIPAVNSIIGPLYRMVGKPLAPAWDVTGWSFEATSGNAEEDDEQLNIYTRIGNRSDEALPYPLIGVSLTDRFEEIIGSRVVDPSGYLPSNVNPRKLVAPGESFEAFIAVESPDALASGYKLDVCYRLPDRRLRCAIGDFR
jgi:predicted Zn finger-like uncharacterized protein